MRIVSLCPSLTELVFDLGRGTDLVGITDYCVHPAGGVGTIERIGGTKTPTVSRIIELEPSLVLLNEEENRIEDAQALQRAGIACLSSLPRSPLETAEMVRSIGDAIDRPERAEKIASEIEYHSSRVRSAVSARPRIRFAYLIWRKPWMSVNDDTFAHSLLALAGGTNVFARRPERYPELTHDDLLQARPSVVLLGSEPFPFAEPHREELARIADVDRSRILLVDGEYLSWYGSRTPDGIDYAETVIERARVLLSSGPKNH